MRVLIGGATGAIGRPLIGFLREACPIRNAQTWSALWREVGEGQCTTEWEAADHLSLVARITRIFGLAVDLDGLRVRWSASGDPEDIAVSLEAMDSGRRTPAKMVRSTEAQIAFMPDDYQGILINREHDGQNRLRAAFQTAESVYVSPEFVMRVGTTILAVHIEPLRIKIMGMIDNRAIQNYDFEAKLLIWATATGHPPEPVTYGGTIKYGHNDFRLDPALQHDWATARLTFFGPDDRRTVRTQLLGF